MAQAFVSRVLAVRNLPETMTEDEVKTLFHHIGASDVHTTPRDGGKRATVFATFPSIPLANVAMKRIKGFRLLGKKLQVRHAREESAKDTATAAAAAAAAAGGEGAPSDTPIAAHLGVRYPLPAGLRYQYPPMNAQIVKNITNAIVSVPRLYTEVLHLMNKMNLPPPFGPVTPAPPVVDEYTQQAEDARARKLALASAAGSGQKRRRMMHGGPLWSDDSDVEEEDDDDSDEDDDDDDVGTRGKGKRGGRAAKRSRVVSSVVMGGSTSSSAVTSSTHTSATTSAATTSKSSGGGMRMSFGTAATSATPPAPLKEEEEEEVDEKPTLAPTPPAPAPAPEPAAAAAAAAAPAGVKDEVMGEAAAVEVVAVDESAMPRAEIAGGRAGEADVAAAMKRANFRDQAPSRKLMVKNLPKTVTEAELAHVFGRFARDLEVQVLKKRLAGSAFVTFPTIAAAQDARDTAHGFKLRGEKPMVVMFARMTK